MVLQSLPWDTICSAVTLSYTLYTFWEMCCLESVTTRARVCACCGTGQLGLELDLSGKTDNWRARAMPEQHTILAHSPHLKSLADAGDGKVWLCGCCRDVRTQPVRRKFNPGHSSAHALNVAKTSFERLHITGFLDVQFQIEQEAKGYAHGSFSNRSLLHTPLLAVKSIATPSQPFPQRLTAVIEYLREHNWLYSKFKPLFAQTHAWAAHFVPPNCWLQCLTRARRRDPVQRDHCDDDDTPFMLGRPAQSSAHIASTGPITAGTLVTVDGSVWQTLCMTQQPLLTTAADQNVPTGISVEFAMFPYLFPHGTGFYTPVESGVGAHFSFSDYVSFRTLSLFSLYTAHSTYLLLMRSISLVLKTLKRGQQVRIFTEEYKRIRAQNPKLSHKAILDKIVKERVPATVPHSPAFYKSGYYDLMCMARVLGLPHYFVTITMDECGDFNTAEYSHIDAFMRNWCGASWKRAPVECSRVFLSRWKSILHKHILGGSRIFGNVKDYAIRYEVQGRQSLHVHMVVWLASDADVAALDRRILACVPADYDEDKEAFTAPTDPLWARLFRNVYHKQQHVHRAECKKKMQGETCGLKFPQPIHTSRVPAMRPDALRWCYYCPRECDRMTTPYLPDLSLLCDAHCNIVKVVREEWIKYLLKYATKREPAGPLCADALPFAEHCFGHLDPVDRDVALRFIETIPWSANEQTLEATGDSIFQTTRDIVYCETKPPTFRTMKTYTHQYGDPRADCMTRYECRPDLSHRGVPFHQFTHNQYHRTVMAKHVNDLKKESAAFDMDVFNDALQFQQDNLGCATGSHASPMPNTRKFAYKDNFLGVDSTQHALFLRPASQLMRCTTYNPIIDPNSWCYTLLLEEVPFTNEATLAPDGNYVRAAIRHHLIDTPERLEHALLENGRVRFESASLTVDAMHKIAKNINELSLVDMHQGMPFTEDVDTERADALWAELETSLNDDIQLDDAQAACIAAVTEKPAGVHVISGGAGTGKSLITRMLASLLVDMGVLLSGTTGNSAFLLSKFANTVHASFGLNTSVLHDANYTAAPDIMRTLRQCKVFIIDEFSMLRNEQFTALLSRVMHAQCLPSLQAVIQNNLFVLVGDHAQLPPICACSESRKTLGVCAQHHLFKNPFFKAVLKTANYHNLQTCHRNNAAAVFLNTVRNTPHLVTDAFVQEHLGHRVNERHTPAANEFVICSHKKQVHKYNSQLLRANKSVSAIKSVGLRVQKTPLNGPKTHVAIDTLTVEQRRTISEKVKDTLPEIAVGAPVRITSNIDIKAGLVNGATGTIVKLNKKSTHITSVKVRLDSTKVSHSIGYLSPKSMFTGGERFGVARLPLILNYAATVHSLQGKTIKDNVFIDIQPFDFGLAYVAVSRNTSFDQVTLARPLTAEDFRVVTLPL